MALGIDASQLRGVWALVTGSSAGIGQEFCVALAQAGANLVLVARRGDLLHALAERLQRDYGIQTHVYPTDLAVPAAALRLRETLEAADIRIRVLCNNAAAGRWGPFDQNASADYAAMIALNCIAPVTLCREFLPHLSSFPSSVIINVSSPAAYQPVPYMAVYAATKALVQSFSLALYEESRARGVLVQTLVPGPTATEFDQKAGAYVSAVQERGSPQAVVRVALAHLAMDQPLVTHARGLWLQRLFAALAPPKVMLRKVAAMFRPPQV